jgi:hydroxypyruvate isomerase
MNIKISANLGFLWNDLSLLEAIQKASSFGFDAVECHWPFELSARELRQGLEAFKMKMISINAPKGDMAQGDFGINAVPGRETESRELIEIAINYAEQINASNVHLLAGITSHPNAHDTFLDNLYFATTIAEPMGINILIEPMNKQVVPGYFLTSLNQATSLLRDLGKPSVRLMFDTFHLYSEHISLGQLYENSAEFIGHIQFSSVPKRQAPHLGTIDYAALIQNIRGLGYSGYFGAEYKPSFDIEGELIWLKKFRKIWEKENEND